MSRTKWTEEQKQKAMAIAKATSFGAAAKQTGIPRGTIGRWFAEAKQRNETNETDETKRPPQKIKQIAEEAVKEAKEEVREYVVDEAKKVAEDILAMVKNALIEVEKIIQNGPNIEEPKAGWLRAVIGAMAQGVEKYQLLTGKPTSRQEVHGQVTKREEYLIEQRLQSDPESRELLKQLYRRSRAMENISEN